LHPPQRLLVDAAIDAHRTPSGRSISIIPARSTKVRPLPRGHTVLAAGASSEAANCSPGLAVAISEGKSLLETFKNKSAGGDLFYRVGNFKHSGS
jgi:hypothetical protein